MLSTMSVHIDIDPNVLLALYMSSHGFAGRVYEL
jgi:hypothetical protein